MLLSLMLLLYTSRVKQERIAALTEEASELKAMIVSTD